MGKPVDKKDFWKKRIEDAQQADIRYSVYLTSQDDWKHLNGVHKKLIGELIKPTDSVLDAGCGYGRNSEWFSNYTGVDFSEDFINLAKQSYPDKTFLVADLKKLPFTDKQFDWAFCISIKQMIVANLGEAVWAKMEEELKRVSKKVLILEYSEPEKHEVLG